MSERDLIQKLRALGVVERREVVLASGSLSDIYCDIKKAFGPPEIFSELINRIGAMLRPSITCIAGAGLGGIPLASAIAFRYGRKFCAIRLEPKAYGLANVIEGHTPSRDDRIAIVDDVFTTGGNVRDVMAKLKPTGANISRVVVVVNRSRGEDKFFPIPVLYLFRIEELI